MRGPLIAMALLARSAEVPVPLALAATIARATPAAAGTCDLTVDGRHRDARVFVDGDRFHIAILGPMGSPQLVLRSDGIGLALQQGAEQWVATDASMALTDLALPTLADAAHLWWGRLPDRPLRGIVALPDGRAWVDLDTGQVALTAILDPSQGVVLVDVGPPGLPSIASLARRGVPLSDSVSLDLAGLVHIDAHCTWTVGPVPASAFRLGAGPDVTTTPLTTLGRQALAELAMLRARRQR